jgi:arsenite-transporting ATPase
MALNTMTRLQWLQAPTRFLFFTGKGGVGKTSLSTATAIALADAGKRVLLVSTDAASNLDDMLGVPLSNQAVAVPGVPGLSLINIDPDEAAKAYRQRVIDQMGPGAPDADKAVVREQLRALAPPRSLRLTSFPACWPMAPRMHTSCLTLRLAVTPCGF